MTYSCSFLTRVPPLAHIGDTFHRVGQQVEPMPGFKPAKAMVGDSIAGV